MAGNWQQQALSAAVGTLIASPAAAAKASAAATSSIFFSCHVVWL